MLVGEGSWETPNIAEMNPDLLDYVKQDLLRSTTRRTRT